MMAGVISIYCIAQNGVCKWHVNSVNVPVFVCMGLFSACEGIDHGCCL